MQRLLFGAILLGAITAVEAADLRFAHARYVAIVFNVGTGILPESTVNPEVLREEREAARRIRAALETQGRFVVIEQPARADLLISVRKGRLGSLEASVPVGTTPGAPPTPAQRTEPSFGVQFSSRDDMIEALEPGGTLIWRATKSNGLAGERPPLLLALQAEVAKAEAAAAAKTP